MGLLDLLFPKRCVGCRKFGDYLCSSCFSTISFDVPEICLICNKQAINGMTHPRCMTNYTIDGAFISVVYKSVIKRLLYQFKYNPYLTDVQHVLHELLYEGIIQKEHFHTVTQHALLTPLPLHVHKLRKRGYNQAEILAKGLGKKLRLPTVPLLQRIKETRSQVGLKRDERRDNITGAFAITPKYYVAADTVLLIDDVITSGSTMNEAAKVLKKAGVKKVYGVALAHGN